MAVFAKSWRRDENGAALERLSPGPGPSHAKVLGGWIKSVGGQRYDGA
jgi:hypothetical protein